MGGWFFLVPHDFVKPDGRKRAAWGPFFSEREARDNWKEIQTWRRSYRLIHLNVTAIQTYDRIEDFAPWLNEATALRPDDV